MLKRIFKTIFILVLCFGTVTSTHAAVTSVSEGSSFITKAEFTSLVNEASDRIEDLELQVDTKINELVESFLARNNIWHPQKQILNGNTQMELMPCTVTLSDNKATGEQTIQDRAVCIDEIKKSGLMVISLFYRAKTPTAAGKTFRWGYMGSMSNTGNWMSDDGIELNVVFYEERKTGDISYSSPERKYVCLIGTAQGVKSLKGTGDSQKGHITAIGLSPIEVLIPAYFFVTKKSKISWAAIESYKFALTASCNIVDETHNDGQNVLVWIQDPVVY